MHDSLLFMYMTLFFFLIGFPLSRLLPGNHFKMRFLTATTIGYGLSAVAITLLYKYDLMIREIFYLFNVVAFLSGIWLTYYFYKNRVKVTKQVVIFISIWIIGSIILLLPGWVGGNQFKVFQGNHWDTFGYLNSAVVYANQPYQYVVDSSEKDMLKEPLLAYAQSNITARPSVHLLYSFVGQIFPLLYYKMYYCFLVFFFSQFILIAIFLLCNVYKEVNPIKIGLIALIFPLGFWGQYVLDINAWSQISSVTILFLLVSLTIICLGVYKNEKPANIEYFKILSLISLVVSSALYLYPENLIFHLPVLLLVLLIFFAYYFYKKLDFKILIVLTLGLFIGILSGVFFYKGTLGFVVGQLNYSTTHNVNWWNFFQSFLFARDGITHSFFSNIVDILIGVFGLYFISPFNSGPIIVKIHRLFLLIFIFTIVISFVIYLMEKYHKRSQEKNIVYTSIIFLTLLVVFSTIPISYLLLKGNFWAAGKALSYMSPYYITLFCLSIFSENSYFKKFFKYAVYGFILFQLSFGLYRIYSAGQNNGIHYEAPYPAIQDVNLKNNFDWDVEKIYPQIKDKNLILIDVEDRWLENYLIVYLYTINKRFYSTNSINTYFGDGKEIGFQKYQGNADAIITFKEKLTVINIKNIK